MNSVGTLLRTERERQGREVAEIAGELCITQRYLRAIEQDDLKSLPGAFFYKSFVKQYAAILALDESGLRAGIEALTAATEPLPMPGADSRYHPVAESRKPIRDLDPIVRDGNRMQFPDGRIGWSLAALIAVAVGCSGLYSWYSKVPQTIAVKNVVAPAPAAPPPVEAVAAEPVKMEAPAPLESAPAALPTVDVSTTTGPDGVNRVVLNLSATEKTWISITSEGKQIFSGILLPSQTKTLSGLEVAKVKVGNAGGLEIRWNGKEIGPIGPRGQVRVLKFTKENFEILQPNQAM